ncbi:MAG: hypothetical protein Q8M99_03150 [Methylotenera sp.]|nr:hypothetical protein [Methylotenera sp.]
MARRVKKIAHKIKEDKPEYIAPKPFTPPPYRWPVGMLFGVETLFIFWALGNQFIPSPSWKSIAFYCNLMLCVFVLAFFAHALWMNKHLYSTTKRIFMVLGLPILVYFWGSIALTYGAGDAITHLVGKPAMIADIFTKNADDDVRFKKEYIAKGEYEKRYFDNRKGCITRLNGFTLKDAMPVDYCVSGPDFAKLPNHVAVNIHGLQSFAGFDVHYIEYDWLKTSFLPLKDVD